MRIAVRAAALNHLDLFVRNGIPDVPLPQIPGADGAGVVDAVGAGVEGVTPGDRVLVQPGLYGNVCEFCRSGEQSLCVKFQIVGEHVPGRSPRRSSCPPATCSRFRRASPSRRRRRFRSPTRPPGGMIVGRAARLGPGETVLIHGAGGGVAGAAVSRSRGSAARGSSRRRRERRRSRWLKEAGAEVVIDYTREDVAKAIRAITAKRGVDVVLDSVGEKTWMTLAAGRAQGRAHRHVRRDERTQPEGGDPPRSSGSRSSILGSTMANDREFRALLSAVASGALTPRIDRVYPLARAARGVRAPRGGKAARKDRSRGRATRSGAGRTGTERGDV